MLDLAVFIDSGFRNTTIAETNHGKTLRAPDWGTDTEPKVVAFWPSARSCEVVDCEDLANDIGHALNTLKAAGALKQGQPEWYRSLKRYASGANSVNDRGRQVD
jgi:hypothetical protein